MCCQSFRNFWYLWKNLCTILMKNISTKCMLRIKVLWKIYKPIYELACEQFSGGFYSYKRPITYLPAKTFSVFIVFNLTWLSFRQISLFRISGKKMTRSRFPQNRAKNLPFSSLYSIGGKLREQIPKGYLQFPLGFNPFARDNTWMLHIIHATWDKSLFNSSFSGLSDGCSLPS